MFCPLFVVVVAFFFLCSQTTCLTKSTYRVSVKLISLYFAPVTVYFALSYGWLVWCASFVISQLLDLDFVALVFACLLAKPCQPKGRFCQPIGICLMTLIYYQDENVLSKCFLIQICFSLGNKETIGKISLTIDVTNSILVLVVK